ncbi:MAG: phosphohydrolase [Flavobacterium psychrophilum]|nr:MAG: phosphohydrolase [Flavobacterium psychrophilum]
MEFEKAKRFILEKLDNELPASLYYHNVGHVLDVYDSVVRHASAVGLDNEVATLLKTAALFHDSGFIIKAQGHEELSCAYAREFLPGFGYDETQISQICGMIMATKIPQSPKNALEEIMADADLDYLGRDDFFEISDNLYAELKKRGEVENENQWNVIQVKFFEQHQYFTKTARELRQAKKMEHLEIIKSKIQ